MSYNELIRMRVFRSLASVDAFKMPDDVLHIHICNCIEREIQFGLIESYIILQIDPTIEVRVSLHYPLKTEVLTWTKSDLIAENVVAYEVHEA